MEVSPLKYTRAFFGKKAEGLSDAAMILQFAQQNKIDPTTDITAVMDQMEQIGKKKNAEFNATSNLKTSRRLLGDQSLGISDDEMIRQYADQFNLPDETDISTIMKMMETSATRGLFEVDRRRDEDQATPFAELFESVKGVKEAFGDTGKSLFTTDLTKKDIDIDAVEEFLKPADARDGFFEQVGKEAIVAGIPFITRQAKKLGQLFATEDSANPERMTKLDKIDNVLNDPDARARFVSESKRYKENPELFTDREKETLRQAALAYETTSEFFQTESGFAKNFATSAIETMGLPVIKGIANMAGSVSRGFGFEGGSDFIDDALRQLNFTDQVLANQDEDSKAAMLGSMLGSIGQTIAAVYTGTGPAGLFAFYGAQGAGDNIESYRKFVRDRGGDPDIAVEALVGLGGMAISGGLGSLLTGRTVGELSIFKNAEEGIQKDLMKRAIEGGYLNNLTESTLLKRGFELVKNVLSDPKLLKETAKSYGKFAAATSPIEAIEETTEEALNEGLMQLAVDGYETDPVEFTKRLALSAVGGALGGAAVGPAARRRYSTNVLNTTNNILGVEGMAAASPQEAALKLSLLEDRANKVISAYGRIPAPALKNYTELRNKLQGIVNGDISPQEAFTPEQMQNASGNIMSLGDIISNPYLAKTLIGQAAQANLGKTAEPISTNQRQAYDTLLQYFQDSDWALENPEAVLELAKRIFMTPLSTGEKRKTAVTVTVSSPGVDGKVVRNYGGTYFTNAADETTVHDEIFHILNDTKTDAEQQEIVNAYNQLYGTNYSSYADPMVRDNIAKKAAEIITGKAQMREGDNEFNRIVKAQRDGLVTEVNPNFGFFSENTAEGLGFGTSQSGIPVTARQLQDGINAGQIRRVYDEEILNDPANTNTILFQDEAGTIFTYKVAEDSEGNENGVLTPVAIKEILPTFGPSLVTALQTVEKPPPIFDMNDPNVQEVIDIVQQTGAKTIEDIEHAKLLRNLTKLGVISTSTEVARQSSREVIERRPPGISVPMVVEQPNQRPTLQGETSTFFIDNAGNTIEVDPNGNPIQAFRVAHATDSQGRAFEIMVPVELDLEQIKRDLFAGQLLLDTGKPIKLLPYSDRMQRLLDYDKVRAFYNKTPEEYYAALNNFENLPRVYQVQLDLLRQKIEGEKRMKEQEAKRTNTPEQKRAKPKKKTTSKKSTATPTIVDTLVKEPEQDLKLVIESMINGTAIGVPGIKLAGDTEAARDAVTGFYLFEVEPALLARLQQEGAVISGKVFIENAEKPGTGEIIETFSNIVSINPAIISEEKLSELEAEPIVTEQYTDISDEDATNSLLETARPEKIGSKGKKFKFIVLTDDEGNEEVFPTKTSAKNNLAARFETENVSIEGSKLFVGGKQYELEFRSANSDELLLQGFGDDAPIIGRLLDLLPPSNVKSDLISAVKFIGKQMINKARGGGLYNEGKVADARRRLLTAALEGKKMLGLDQQTQEVIDQAIELTQDIKPELVEEVPVPVNLEEAAPKKSIQAMRRSVTRFNKKGDVGLEILDPNTGAFRFTTKQSNAVQTFIGGAENLGANSVIQSQTEENGKKFYIVEGNFHPTVLAAISSTNPDMYKLINDPIILSADPVDTDVNDEAQISEEDELDPETLKEPTEEETEKPVEIKSAESFIQPTNEEEFLEKRRKNEEAELKRYISQRKSRAKSKAKKAAQREIMPRANSDQFDKFYEVVLKHEGKIKVKETKTFGGGVRAAITQFILGGNVIAEWYNYEESGKYRYKIHKDYINDPAKLDRELKCR